MTVELFDRPASADLAPALHAEGSYAYLSRSGRPEIGTVREVLEEWFTRYPRPHQSEFKARFTNDADALHEPAFFELYLHELFTRLGYTLTLHPVLSQVTTVPDYLAEKQSEQPFYLEATVAGAHGSNPGAARRQNRIRDILNAINTPDFWLHAEHLAIPKVDLPRSRLTKEIQAWVDSLDPINERAPYPRRIFRVDDFAVEILALRKGQKARGTSGRAVGIETSGVGIIDDITPLRRALKAKFGKYGMMDKPYIVALNALRDFVNDVDIEAALFGDLAVNTQTGQTIYNERGLWTPRSSRRVSGVLGFRRLRWDNIPRVTPVLWLNLWAERPLHQAAFSFTKRSVRPDGSFAEETGPGGAELFDLPATWPEREATNS